MSNPDRGAYTPPTDAPLSFDARQPVRGSRPMPTALIISAVVLIVLVAAIVVVYRSGVRQSGQAPQAVGEPVGEMKAPAPAAEQPRDPAAGLVIYQSEAGDPPPASPNFVPAPEAPQPRNLPVVTAPAPAAPVAAPVVALPVAPVVAEPVLKPTVVAPKPKPVTPVAPVVAKTPTPVPAATGGAAVVQIGAFSSSALADKGWNDAVAIAPGAAAGKGKKVEAVQVNGGTLYRTQVTGFGSRALATQFCDKLKAAGKQCFVK